MLQRKKAEEPAKRKFILSDDELDKKTSTPEYSEFKDENGFDRRNTNFYISADEGEADIVLLPNEEGIFSPYVLDMHTLQVVTKKGNKLWIDEPCQKNFGSHCPYCDAAKANTAISQSRSKFVYPILDLRGKRTKDGFDGIPAPMFYVTHKAVVSQIQDIKREIGNLEGIVLTVTKKEKDTFIKVKTERVPGSRSSTDVIYEGDFPEKTPNFDVIWGTPRTEEEIENQISGI